MKDFEICKIRYTICNACLVLSIAYNLRGESKTEQMAIFPDGKYQIPDNFQKYHENGDMNEAEYHDFVDYVEKIANYWCEDL